MKRQQTVVTKEDKKKLMAEENKQSEFLAAIKYVSEQVSERAVEDHVNGHGLHAHKDEAEALRFLAIQLMQLFGPIPSMTELDVIAE